MNCKTYKLSDSVTLSYISTDRFKKARLTLSLTVPLDRELSPGYSLVLPAAFLGTEAFPDFRSVCRRSEELYAADISEFCIARGDFQIVGLTASMLNDSYISEEDRGNGLSVLGGVFGMFSDILCRPLYREADVETEKLNRINRIKSRQDDAFGYAKYRFARIMFENEPCGYPLSGEIPQVEAITPQTLEKSRLELYGNAPAEFFYCGQADVKTVIELIKSSFPGISETAKRLHAGKTIVKTVKPKRTEESGEYRQGNLLVGFRTGTVLSDSEFYAVEMLNQIYGDGTLSKLFINVREKKSLCYFCSSSYDEERGVIAVGCGIDCEKYTEALDEILFQLDEIKRGNITEAEMTAARGTIASDCRAAEDHPTDYEDFVRTERIFGGPSTIEEYRRGVMSVTVDEIVAAANRVSLDTVYFLRGTLEGDGFDE